MKEPSHLLTKDDINTSTEKNIRWLQPKRAIYTGNLCRLNNMVKVYIFLSK